MMVLGGVAVSYERGTPVRDYLNVHPPTSTFPSALLRGKHGASRKYINTLRSVKATGVPLLTRNRNP